MAINFPEGSAENSPFTDADSGITYTWDGAKWVGQTGGNSGNQNLQEVCDEGNTTDTDITSTGTVFGSRIRTSNFLTANTGTGGSMNNDGITSRTNAGFATYQVQNASNNHTRTFWINGTGDVNIEAGGAGIIFPETNTGSTNPNCLADYEQGTWTPAITSV